MNWLERLQYAGYGALAASLLILLLIEVYQ